MSYEKSTLRAELQECNTRIDKRLGHIMSVKTYKIIKASTQLVGAAGGVYAMTLGADPMFAMMLITFVIAGPETIDYILSIES